MNHRFADQLNLSNPDRSVDWSIQEGMHVLGDTRLIQIALDNLLGNAWKYSAKTEHAKIEIAATEKDASIIFSIQDNGAGFNMAYSDKLFKPFQRLHHEQEFEGTGIGLATVWRIITRHMGCIWACGEAGNGAIFYFSLPIKPLIT